MPEVLTLTADVSIQAAADGKKRPRVSITAYNGGLMNVGGWGAIAIELSGLEIPSSVPLLADHDQSLSGVVGSGTPRVDRGSLTVTGHLTDSEAGRGVLALARDDVPLQASVGVEPTQRRYIPAGEQATVNGKTITAEEPGFTLITSGSLREISIVAVGADSSTSVSIAASLQKRGEIMSTDTPKKPDTPQSDFDRVQAAWDSAHWNYSDAAPYARAHRAMVSAAAGRLDFGIFESELRQAQADDQELQRIRAERPKAPAIHSGGGVPSSAAVQAAAFLHVGHEAAGLEALGEQAMEAGRQLRCRHVLNLCEAALVAEGRDVPSNRDQMIRASFSTTNLPGILGNVANKLLLDSYKAVPSVARIVAKKLSANDFKTHTGYRLGGDFTFEKVGAGGELKHAVPAESSYTFQVDTYGKIFSLTRQSLVNDDMSAFEEVPRLIGRGAAVALEHAFWTLVLANTGNFFHDDNSNAIGDALDIDGLSAAVTKMRQFVDGEGVPVLVSPKYLVVPPELETTGDSLHTSTNIVVAGDTDVEQPDGNPHKGKYQPLVVPHLSNSSYTGYSTTAWYLFGIPDDVAAFGIAYLNGMESPVVEDAPLPGDVLGQAWRGYLDFGVCQIDEKGAVKSTGDS